MLEALWQCASVGGFRLAEHLFLEITMLLHSSFHQKKPSHIDITGICFSKSVHVALNLLLAGMFLKGHQCFLSDTGNSPSVFRNPSSVTSSSRMGQEDTICYI